MPCQGDCEKAQTCEIDFDAKVVALNNSLVDLRSISDSINAIEYQSRLKDMMSKYPVCVQIAIAENNILQVRLKNRV